MKLRMEEQLDSVSRTLEFVFLYQLGIDPQSEFSSPRENMHTAYMDVQPRRAAATPLPPA
jgi:hypothetical protein